MPAAREAAASEQAAGSNERDDASAQQASKSLQKLTGVPSAVGLRWGAVG